MFVVLLIALLSVPLLELYVIIQVAGGVGTAQTIGLLVLVSVVGAWMVRRSGLGVLAQVQQRLSRGELPTVELVDGLLIVIAGALMLTPGFLTDGVGLLLLFPPTRLLVRSLLVGYFTKRMRSGAWTAATGRQSGFGFTFGESTRGPHGRRGPQRDHGWHGEARGSARFGSGPSDVRDVYEVREVREQPDAREDQDGD